MNVTVIPRLMVTFHHLSLSLSGHSGRRREVQYSAHEDTIGGGEVGGSRNGVTTGEQVVLRTVRGNFWLSQAGWLFVVRSARNGSETRQRRERVVHKRNESMAREGRGSSSGKMGGGGGG